MDSIENGGGGDGESSSTWRAFARAMETVGVVSVAGFGGALAGVSVARRRAAVSAAVPRTARGGRGRARRRRPDPDLPTRWAATCAGFASVVEIARVVSPAGAALRSADHDGRAAEAIATVGDAVVGGAFAGAAFRGAAVADRRRRPVAAPGVGAARGAVPGAALGLAAGAARWSLSEAQRAIDEQLSRRTTTTTTTTEEHQSDHERRLETMSVEQLTEELRRTREENDADDDEDRPPRTDDR